MERCQDIITYTIEKLKIRLLSLGFDKEKMEKLTLSDIEEIRNHILAILDGKK